MNAVEKNRLSQEIKMQTNALRRISRWRMLALALSTSGVALTYAGFSGESSRLLFGIPGILMIAAGALGAIILNLGLKNGRRNVEKMLNLLK